MIIRKAEIEDIADIMKIYSSCVKGMIALGIDQWDESYPNKEVINSDISSGSYFVGCIERKLVCGLTIDQKQDPTYLSIDWQDKTNRFLVVHRLCAKTSVWSRGMGRKMMAFAEEMALKKGLSSIRLDTYINNPKAINFYKGLGYQKRGYIHLKPNKDIYYCFEKLLR